MTPHVVLLARHSTLTPFTYDGDALSSFDCGGEITCMGIRKRTHKAQDESVLQVISDDVRDGLLCRLQFLSVVCTYV